MELYGHKTNGGAQYYSTTCIETPSGKKEGTLKGAVIRTDGDELEIFNYYALWNAGFKSVVLPDGQRIDLQKEMEHKTH